MYLIEAVTRFRKFYLQNRMSHERTVEFLIFHLGRNTPSVAAAWEAVFIEDDGAWDAE